MSLGETAVTATSAVEQQIKEILKEVGRVHLRGWANYPRDTTLDRRPVHPPSACRKCTILGRHPKLVEYIWGLR